MRKLGIACGGLRWVRLPMLVCTASFAILSAVVRPALADVLVCTFKKGNDAYVGTCSVPCRVNALAIDIDGPRKGFSCSEPERMVNASAKVSSI